MHVERLFKPRHRPIGVHASLALNRIEIALKTLRKLKSLSQKGGRQHPRPSAGRRILPKCIEMHFAALLLGHVSGVALCRSAARLQHILA